jgi:putative methionine-R-sulfoxide reductase with GAF domain
MKHDSIEDSGPGPQQIYPVPVTPGGQQASPAPAGGENSSEPPVDREKHQGLAEIADRDLEVTLQLLVERGQFLTGASAASIALRQGDAMICRARVGQIAPEPGTQSQIDSGLIAESVRTQQTLRCDHAETDSRVNQERCRALGVASAMVVPLVHEQEVIGLFEFLSDRANAFEQRDAEAIEHLAELIQTAIQNAGAVRRGAQEIAAIPPNRHAHEELTAQEAVSHAEVAGQPPDSPAQDQSLPTSQPLRATAVRIHTCSSCGFPISEGRRLCVDCEAAEDQNQDGTLRPSSVVLTQLRETSEPSWFRANIYTIGLVIVFGLTLAFLLWTRHL